MSDNSIRILVYGSKLNGKTSLINLLTKTNSSNNSDSSQQETGCVYNGREYIFTEIISLEIDDKNYFKEVNAERKLQKFLTRKDSTGYALAIQVKKMQPILETDKVNYDFVIKNIFRKKIKCLCAISFAEMSSIDEYWTKNVNEFSHRGLEFDRGHAICSGFSVNPVFEKAFEKVRNASYDSLWKSIEQLTTPRIDVQPTFGYLTRFIRQFWDWDSKSYASSSNETTDKKPMDKKVNTLTFSFC